MDLWERGSALDLLDGLLRESGNRGRVALVAGEAGIGKTSLVTEFARRAGSQARVLWGVCDRLVTPRALGPLHDIGRLTGGVLAERVSAGATQEAIFDAFLDEISQPAERLGPVVVVEDAHWADEGTLDWLAFLGRRLDRRSTLLVLTYRSDEVGPEHPLRGVLAALPASTARRVPVAALTRDCVREQARLAGRDADSVYRLAGGNPLLVTELLKSDSDDVPGAVQDLILDRIRALSAPARDVAHLVAVVPTRADAVVAASSGAVDECIAAGVLVESGDGVSYRHELLRSAVEDSLSPARRAALHGQVLEILSGQPGVDPGRLVHHARAARDADAVLRFGQLAGASAVRQGAHREAAAHFQAAVAHRARIPEPEQAALLEQYATAANLAGWHEEALHAREAAAVIRETLGQSDLLGENLCWISRLSWWTGRIASGREAGARSVTVLEGAPPSTYLAQAYANQSALHLTTHELDDAVRLAERARDLAEEFGDEVVAIYSTITLGTAWLVTDPPRGRAVLEAAHQRALAGGYVEHAARALASLCLVPADELAEYDAAAPAMDRSLAFNEEHDLEGMLLMVLGARAKLRLERGDWTDALTDAEATLARSGLRGVNAALPLVTRGRIEAARGAPDALATLDLALRAAEGVGDVPLVVPVADARAEYWLWCGELEHAREEARRGLSFAGAAGQPFLIGRLAWRLWQCGGTDEMPATAALPFRQMVHGEWSEAAAEWERRGGTYLRAEALALGDEPAAGEALRILDGLGATRPADHLRAQLRKRGILRVPRGPRRATAANAAGLTPRQVDVLVLLVEGLSNAQIAARLTLSPKTVDHHVHALLRTLGVANRGQAVAVAHRRQLVG